MDTTNNTHEKGVLDHLTGERVDKALAQLYPSYSRTHIQTALQQGVLVVRAHNGAALRASDKVRGGESLHGHIPDHTDHTAWTHGMDPVSADETPRPEIGIVHADPHFLVLDKPAGWVVHPAPGNRHNTLANWLLAAYPELQSLPRAGLIHRLDKDTTGLLVVARTLSAHTHLTQQLNARSIQREYAALVQGIPRLKQCIDAPLGRHPRHRTKRAVLPHGGKPARTHFEIWEKYRAHALLRVRLETGRTHQIRVHLQHIRCPVVGDPQYGAGLRMPPNPLPELLSCLQTAKRQALHARLLGFAHPVHGEWQAWESPLPPDFCTWLDALRLDALRANAVQTNR